MDGTTLTITVKDDNSATTVTQNVDSLEFKVAGPEETSTVMQKQDSVLVTVKNFTVDAEKIEMTSSADTSHTASGKYTVAATGDLSLSSDAKVKTTSTGDTLITATGALTAKATMDATVKGQNLLAEGTMGATLKGGTTVDVKGLQIGIAATAKLEMAGPMTNVGKNITTISGQMVKVEGTLVKLG
jgi:hypothetical protein